MMMTGAVLNLVEKYWRFIQCLDKDKMFLKHISGFKNNFGCVEVIQNMFQCTWKNIYDMSRFHIIEHILLKIHFLYI